MWRGAPASAGFDSQILPPVDNQAFLMMIYPNAVPWASAGTERVAANQSSTGCERSARMGTRRPAIPTGSSAISTPFSKGKPSRFGTGTPSDVPPQAAGRSRRAGGIGVWESPAFRRGRFKVRDSLEGIYPLLRYYRFSSERELLRTLGSLGDLPGESPRLGRLECASLAKAHPVAAIER